jgi:CRP/FNR family cyclic AMP-dependent transcriptional regulator
VQQLDQAVDAKRLSDILIFRFLGESELDRIGQYCEYLAYDPAEIIIEKGTLTPGLYAVVEGNVKVASKAESGQEIYICTLGPGEVFGEAGMFMQVKRTADVIALEPTTVLRITRENLLKYVRAYSDAGVKILLVIIYSLLRKLKEANEELTYERQMDVDQGDIDSLVGDFLRN